MSILLERISAQPPLKSTEGGDSGYDSDNLSEDLFNESDGEGYESDDSILNDECFASSTTNVPFLKGYAFGTKCNTADDIIKKLKSGVAAPLIDCDHVYLPHELLKSKLNLSKIDMRGRRHACIYYVTEIGKIGRATSGMKRGTFYMSMQVTEH